MIDPRKSRVLLTGGAGFIGSALLWGLNRRGCDDVVVADLLGDSEKWRNLVPLRYADYIEADDLLPKLQDDDLGEFDVVLHLGACSSTTERNAAYLARNNYEFTKRLAEWALSRGCRFAYASSAATYGDGSAGMNDRETDLLRFRPLNMYGYSKQMFDLYAAREGLLDRVCGLKYFNVFGPNENHKADMRSLVCKAHSEVLETGMVKLFKSYRPDFHDGEQRRDFLYIKDAVAMTLHLVFDVDATGLFNLGSGQSHTWIELADALFAAMGRNPHIEFKEMPEGMRAKYQYDTRADVGRLRESGYTAPVTPLADAVADYVQNYLAPDRRLGEESEKRSADDLSGGRSSC